MAGLPPISLENHHHHQNTLHCLCRLIQEPWCFSLPWACGRGVAPRRTAIGGFNVMSLQDRDFSLKLPFSAKKYEKVRETVGVARNVTTVMKSPLHLQGSVKRMDMGFFCWLLQRRFTHCRTNHQSIIHCL